MSQVEKALTKEKEKISEFLNNVYKDGRDLNYWCLNLSKYMEIKCNNKRKLFK